MGSVLIRNSLRRGTIAGKSSRWFPAGLSGCSLPSRRLFHNTLSRNVVKPYLLADIGEGITECRVVNWFVKPGDRVDQFDSICEVQSDKASVEITSRYDGVITAIHHEVDDMATVGKPLLDVDVDEETSSSEEPTLQSIDAPSKASENASDKSIAQNVFTKDNELSEAASGPITAKNSGLAAPSVKHMLRDHRINLVDIKGTGKDGRVLKEDVQQYIAAHKSASSATPSLLTPPEAQANDKTVHLTPIGNQMYKVMADALNIPHFGYAHNVDFTTLNNLREKFNREMKATSSVREGSVLKLTALPIIVKSLSLAFNQHPGLNAHLDTLTDPGKPHLIVKGSHDFGIAIDTPHGLLVPVVRGVQNRSILSIAAEINRLGDLAKRGALAPQDMKGATFTVSNIGSIGGSVVSPVIVPPMVGILAIGKTEEVPEFVNDGHGESRIIKRQKTVFSWSADHRVLDGATVARCAEYLGNVIEEIAGIGVFLR